MFLSNTAKSWYQQAAEIILQSRKPEPGQQKSLQKCQFKHNQYSILADNRFQQRLAQVIIFSFNLIHILQPKKYS